MITDILYRCPSCGSFDWLNGSRCTRCNASIRVLSRSEVSINGTQHSIADLYRKILTFDLSADDSGTILRSGRVALSREAVKGTIRGLGGVIAAHFTRAAFDEGSLTLKTRGLDFTGREESAMMPFEDITALTIESNTIIVISRKYGILFFDFMDESGKKWEDCIRKALSDFHAPRKIREFYPRLSFEDGFRDHPARAEGHGELRVPLKKWYNTDTSIIFSIVRTLARPVIKSLFTVDIKGLENIPEKGAAVLLSNHTSFLDSIILGVFPRRNIWFMAKNSEFKGPLLTWALKRARAFPVRRYTHDVQAVRNAVRIVRQGHVLGIYPEGERTWDNTLLPFRKGTMRLVLALGKPVIPVGISGAYDLMPRWESSIVRTPVKIRIGEPFSAAHIPIPRQTRSDIAELEHALRSRITNLVGDMR